MEVEGHWVDRSASIRATELLGKEAGMFVDRREVGTPGEFARLDDSALISHVLSGMMTIEHDDGQ